VQACLAGDIICVNHNCYKTRCKADEKKIASIERRNIQILELNINN
jgi:hypothetical protein